MTNFSEIPLKARKIAKAKQALLAAMLERLTTRRLDEISVKELSIAADVSEPTFFNYFSRKQDLLGYFIQLWSLDMSWRVAKKMGGPSAREAIEDIYLETARQIKENPGVISEILAWQAREGKLPNLNSLGVADKLIAFPEREGIEDLPSPWLEGLFPPLIEQAIIEGSLPVGVDKDSIFLGLGAIFFGLPAIAGALGPEGFAPASLRLIDLLWKGIITESQERG